MYLSFDPGDTTGIAEFLDDGTLTWMGQVSLKDLMEYLNNYEPTREMTVIIEDFVLFARRAQQQAGSRMKASQAIGIIKMFASRHNAKVVMQQASIKPIALKLTGARMPSKHSQTHQIDAYLHGAYYLINQGILETKLQRKMREQSEKG